MFILFNLILGRLQKWQKRWLDFGYGAYWDACFCVFGIIFICLGFPLLSGQNSVWILFSVVGVMAEIIIAMVVYTTVIEKKYKKK